MTTPAPPPRRTSTSIGLASTATAQAHGGQLVELSRLLARQAARACLCQEPTEDGRDRPGPTPPKSPDLEKGARR